MSQTNDDGIGRTIAEQLGLSPMTANGRWLAMRWGVRRLHVFSARKGPGELINVSGLMLECIKGIYVEIILDPSDTYNVKIFKLARRGSKAAGQGRGIVVPEETTDVYAEDLAETINGLFHRNYP